MKRIDKERVVEFYKEYSLMHGDNVDCNLTDNQIEIISQTLMFSVWMLNFHYKEVISSLRDVIKKINNGKI